MKTKYNYTLYYYVYNEKISFVKIELYCVFIYMHRNGEDIHTA